MKTKLSILYFLQFSIWGCYLTSLGQFLGSGGLGSDIAWFYAAIGIVSVVSPPLLGKLADKTGYPSRILGACHLGAAMFMLAFWWNGYSNEHLTFLPTYLLYLGFLLLYMPTMALSNTTSFALLSQNNLRPDTAFPSVRIWGTVGFVAAMWFVNSAYWYNGALGFTFSDTSFLGRIRFQYNSMQLLCSGIMGMITAVYVSLILPQQHFEIKRNWLTRDRKETLWNSIQPFFKDARIRTFLIFVALTGVCLQISNGFVTPYITHFSGISEFAYSLASGNATMLFSLSQISEAFCILLVGYFLSGRGIKWVYGVGIFAWGLRFLFLAIGNPGGGLWAFVCSMLVYGIAFNFITIAGHIYIQQVAPDNNKGFAQGIMMFMGNGVGATTGIIIAGQVVNNWCSWQMVSLVGSDTLTRLFMGDWVWPWSIFSVYAFILLLLWLILFKSRSNTPS